MKQHISGENKMRKFSIIVLYALAFLGIALFTFPVMAQKSNLQPPINQNKKERLINLDLFNVRLYDVINEIGKYADVNILVDTYWNGLPLPKVQFTDKTVKEALEYVANLYECEIIAEKEIFVLRDKLWFRRIAEGKQTQQIWLEQPSILIKRLDNSNSNSTKIVSNKNGVKTKPKKPLPAQFIKMEVKTAPLDKIKTMFNTQTGWQLTLDKELLERRISCYCPKVKP